MSRRIEISSISDSMSNTAPFWQTVGRGIIGRCPNCGKGHLFRSYLKQVDHCESCGEPFEHIRADDGPAWLTIILVGHLLAPFMLYTLPNSTWPEAVLMAIWMVLAAILMFALLPRSKGLFIAMIWRMHPLEK